jgi:hypothetical protein
MLHTLYEILWAAGLWWLKIYFSFRILKFLYIFVNSVYGHFIARPLDLTSFKDKWTVVTGCTDGIGRAYIGKFLKYSNYKNVNKFRGVVHIARNPEVLSNCPQ